MKSKDLRLLLSMGGSRRLFVGVVFGAIVSTAITLANAFLIAAVIIGVIYQHPNVQLHIATLAALWGAKAIFTSQFERWCAGQASRLKASLRESVVASSQALISISPSHLATLLTKGANSLDIYIGKFLPQIFGASLTPIAVIFAIASEDFTAAIIALLTLPMIPLFGALIGRFTNQAVSAKWQSLGTLSRYFEDSLRGIYTLKIFGRTDSQSTRIKTMGDRYTDETMKVLRISFLSAFVLELAATISVALIAVSVGLRLVGGTIEFFPALVVLILAPEVYFPLRNAASLFHASADGGAALTEILEISQRYPRTFGKGAIEISEIKEISWKGWISPFSSAELPAVELRSGEALVIRGPSGSGKSTFLNALLGFNQSAEITLNRISHHEIEERSLYAQIGWIPQSPNLIAGNLRQLFQQVEPNIEDAEIRQALERVGLQLQELPDGLETKIGATGERNGEISGGQRRRLAIARALLRSPSLIIADEPTADLDPISAQHILKVLEEIALSGAIVIAVLHAPDQNLSGASEIEMVAP